MKDSNKSNKLDVVIVEPHHHALEHIHHTLRRNVRKQKHVNNSSRSTSKSIMPSWTMIHFDSHPDLACPNDTIPARLCFTPRQQMTQQINKSLVGVGDEDRAVCSNDNDNDDDNNDDNNDNNDDDDDSLRKDLYEFLDTSQSGIAEWILPLVLAGGLKTIYWLKNDWCDQFHNGTYDIAVGAWVPPPPQHQQHQNNQQQQQQQQQQVTLPKHTNDSIIISSFLDLPNNASFKTSCSHNYYLDDDSVVPDNELLLKQQFKLIVSDLRQDDLSNVNIDIDIDIDTTSTLTLTSTSTSKVKSTPPNARVAPTSKSKSQIDQNDDWILDVCLDYFICANPFIAELEGIDVNITKHLIRAVTESQFRKMIANTDADTGADADVDVDADVDTNINTTSILEEEEANLYQSMSNQFLDLVSTFFHQFSFMIPSSLPLSSSSSYSSSSTNVNNINIDIDKYNFLDEQQYDQLYNLYDPPSLGEEIWYDLLSSLIEWTRNTTIQGEHERENEHGREHEHGRERENEHEHEHEHGRECEITTSKLCEIIINALPSITLPHSIGLQNENSSSTELSKEILDKVKLFGEDLRYHKWNNNNVDGHHENEDGNGNDNDNGNGNDTTNNIYKKPPNIITIARSSEDGFTPMAVVDHLQRAVLDEIHSVYCNCERDFHMVSSSLPSSSLPSAQETTEPMPINYYDIQCNNCNINLVLDYGEYEGSTLD